MKKRGIVAGIIAALIVLDQLVKAYVVQNIALGEIKSWIPNLVSLTYLQNRGAAFSMLQDQQWFFAVITLVLDYFDTVNGNSGSWFVFFIFFSLGNLVNNVYAIDDLTKDRVFAV